MTNNLLRFVTKNFWYKMLSIFLAVVVWGIIQGEQVYEVNREIRVSLNVPEGFAIRGENIRMRAATIRGPRVWMLELPEVLEAEVDVPAFKGKPFNIRLGKDKLDYWNERLQLIIHDPYIEGFVDKEVERTIPIKEVLQGSPAEGFIVERVSIEPRYVTVTGVNADLVRVRQIVTEPIDISGLKSSKSVEAKLIAPGLQPEAMAFNKATVWLKVGDSKVNKRFGSIPIALEGGRYKATVKPEFASVMVQASPGAFEFISSDDFKAFVELEGLTPGLYELDIKVKIPSDTVLIDTFPKKAIVTILK